jgi:parvulin-like peptidyl-prolyl isomerase
LAAFAVLLLAPLAVRAQTPPDAAATVNGQAISKSMVDRPLEAVPADKLAKAREEIINYLIDTAVVDQYLLALKITIEEKEVDARLAEVEAELKKSNQTLADTLKKLKLTQPEFRAQVTADLRWEKFATQQSAEPNLKAMFQRSPEMFDGSQVRARHILLAPGDDPKAQQTAVAELGAIRAKVEAAAAAAVAKLPPTTDALAREQAKLAETEKAFAAIAAEKSTCPSKRDGGDVNWFPRAGSMVEPFAAAAFALKPAEMSQPVKTQFGYHLILCTGRKPGMVVKFEDVKDEVREIYCGKLRDAVIAQERPKAKIVIAK